MRITDIWPNAGDDYYEVEIAKDRYVCVKKANGDDGRTSFVYVMDNEDGTMVYDRGSNTYEDKVNEKAVVQFVRKVEKNLKT